MLRSAYMTGLSEYRGIGRGLLWGATVIASSNPPNGFTDTQVLNFVNNAIRGRHAARPDVDGQTLYGRSAVFALARPPKPADPTRRGQSMAYWRACD